MAHPGAPIEGPTQSGESDRRGPLSKQGPRYLRWALVEAATVACRHPIYRERYQRTKAQLGKQRGAKVAQVELARRLAEAIWHMGVDGVQEGVNTCADLLRKHSAPARRWTIDESGS